jgi:hypothetical protein
MQPVQLRYPSDKTRSLSDYGIVGGRSVVWATNPNQEDRVPAYHTSLAAEFHVLSVLYRLGVRRHADPRKPESGRYRDSLSRAGRVATIDVKGLAGKTSWPVDNLKSHFPRGHFLIFVCFLGSIENPAAPPEVYVVPASAVRHLIYHAPGGRKVVPLSSLRAKGSRLRDAWQLLRRAST